MSADFDQRMAQLRERFVARAQDERAQLIAAIATMERSEIRRLSHGLSGSAGVFGYPEIGHDAQALEEAVDGGADDDELRRLSAKLIDRMEAAQRA